VPLGRSQRRESASSTGKTRFVTSPACDIPACDIIELCRINELWRTNELCRINTRSRPTTLA
jgi:hypothetical protein